MAEKASIVNVLKRSVDLPPAQIWAQVLDAGQVPPCSIRTMYRVLAANAEVRERRNQLRHPMCVVSARETGSIPSARGVFGNRGVLWIAFPERPTDADDA